MLSHARLPPPPPCGSDTHYGRGGSKFSASPQCDPFVRGHRPYGLVPGPTRISSSDPLCSGKRQKVRKRDQAGGSDKQRAADDHRRCFVNPPGKSWLRSINQAPHADPELSRRCRARRSTRHLGQTPSKKQRGSFSKSAIELDSFFFVDYLCGEIDRLLTPQKSKFLASFPLESFPTDVCCRVSRTAWNTAPPSASSTPTRWSSSPTSGL